MRRDDAQRPLVVEQRLSVDGVGDDDVVRREPGSVPPAKHHQIAVLSSRACDATAFPDRSRGTGARHEQLADQHSLVADFLASSATVTVVRGGLGSAAVSVNGVVTSPPTDGCPVPWPSWPCSESRPPRGEMRTHSRIILRYAKRPPIRLSAFESLISASPVLCSRLIQKLMHTSIAFAFEAVMRTSAQAAPRRRRPGRRAVRSCESGGLGVGLERLAEIARGELLRDRLQVHGSVAARRQPGRWRRPRWRRRPIRGNGAWPYSRSPWRWRRAASTPRPSPSRPGVLRGSSPLASGCCAAVTTRVSPSARVSIAVSRDILDIRSS